MSHDVVRPPIIFCLLALAVINLVWAAMTRVTLNTEHLMDVAVWVLAFGLVWFALRRMGGTVPRAIAVTRTFSEIMCFLMIFSVVVPVFNHLTMSLPFPYADDMLARWDALLGLNWIAYFEWVHARPLLIVVYDVAYAKLGLVTLGALFLLSLRNEPGRTRYFLEIFFITAMISIVAGAAFPALAAVDRYIPDLAAYPNFADAPGIYHLEHFARLRGEGEIVINAVGLPGLVTFPSFHTASGILLCIGMWRTWAFWPFVVYSAVMIAASPIFGAHYFIDQIVGAALAVLVAAMVLRQPRHAGLFARPGRTDPRAAPQPA